MSTNTDYLTANENAYNKLADQYAQRIYDYTDKDVPLLQPFMKQLKARFDRPNVLELGPGSGLALRMFEEEGFSTTAIEIAAQIIEVSRKTSPHTEYIHDDFLRHDFGDASYDGIFAKAFIHLFPKEDALKVLDKIYNMASRNGVLFIATTSHKVASEGYEEKADYEDSPKRFRRKWTEHELLEALGTRWSVVHRHYSEDRGKQWMAFTLVKH